MDDMIRHLKALIAEGKEAINEADHSILFVVSSNVIDRDNEIVDAQAVLDAIQRPGEFADNPIAPPAHMDRLDSGMPACVGHWDVATAKLVTRGKRQAVQMRLLFAWDTPLGDVHWRVYSQRHQRAVSLGFRSREWHVEKINGRDVRVITQIDLYEISCVAIPANPQALAVKLGPAAEPLAARIDDIIRRLDAQIDRQIEQRLAAKLGEQTDQTLTDPDDLARAFLGGAPDPIVGAEDDAEVIEYVLDRIESDITMDGD